MRRRVVELCLDGWEDMLPTLSVNQFDGLELEPQETIGDRHFGTIGDRHFGGQVTDSRRCPGDRHPRVNLRAEMNRFLPLFVVLFRLCQKSFMFTDCR